MVVGYGDSAVEDLLCKVVFPAYCRTGGTWWGSGKVGKVEAARDGVKNVDPNCGANRGGFVDCRDDIGKDVSVCGWRW